MKTPDVLVLGAGGILGEAWMSAVLAGMDEGPNFDSCACRSYVGTSAGSIVAASLAAGMTPKERLGKLPEQPPVADQPGGGSRLRALGAAAGIGSAAIAPLASVALSSAAAGGALIRRAALAAIPQGKRSLWGIRVWIDGSGVDWDGRLRIPTVELESGRRVVFGLDDSPEGVSVGKAVEASCAVPGVFRPMRHGGRSYVDGGAWSLTNMDVADVRRRDRVLCLNPTGAFRPGISQPAGVIGPVSRGVATTEAVVLRGRGAKVSIVNPDQASAAAMGSNLMSSRNRDGVIEAGLAQGRRLARSSRAKAA